MLRWSIDFENAPRMRWLEAFLLVSCAALALLAGTQVDARLGRYRSQEEAATLWSGSQLKRIAPGFEGILADVYWLRTVQYYGGQRAFARDRRYDLLAPLTEVTTTLDPHFDIAYRYGATFLAEPYPEGAGEGDQAVALLRKGVEHNPDNFRLWQYLAYFQFLYQDDYDGAVATLMKASRRAWAPAWLRTLAASFLVQRGQTDRARRIWQQIYQSSEPGPLKENAAHRLSAFTAHDHVQALDRLAQMFRARTGRFPTGWQELARTGALHSQPLDPSGRPYAYDPATGQFSVSGASILYPYYRGIR
jgi:tetratricopeptide (TPR) repeat protein